MDGSFPLYFLSLWTCAHAFNTPIFVEGPAGQLMCSETNHKTGACKTVMFDIRHFVCTLMKSKSDPVTERESEMLIFKKVSMCVLPSEDCHTTVSSVSLCKQIRLGTSNITGFTEVDPNTLHVQKVRKTEQEAPGIHGKDNTPSKSQSEMTPKTSRARDVQPTQGKCDNRLIQACKKGKLNLVKSSLSTRNMDINCRDKRERTPVMWTAFSGQVEVFDYLMSLDCELSTRDEYNNTILHIACRYCHGNIVRKLLESEKCDIESRGDHNRTPVMWAAYKGNTEIFQLLQTKGCNLTIVDQYNYNILHAACISGSVGLVKHILSLNIFSIDVQGWDGETPVMLALRYEIIKYLVSRGCNLTAVDNDGNNVLHAACRRCKSVHVVKYLMTHGCAGMEKVTNKDGLKPSQIAENCKNKRLIWFLKGKK